MSECVTHTPGPWKTEPRDIGGFTIERPSYTTVTREMPVALVPTNRRDAQEVEANARLIAAAPELLDACRTALLYANSSRSAPPLRRQLAAAIAKAEGRAP